jgi:hypothetical protein
MVSIEWLKEKPEWAPIGFTPCSWVLTGGNKSFNGVAPRKSIDRPTEKIFEQRLQVGFWQSGRGGSFGETGFQ